MSTPLRRLGTDVPLTTTHSIGPTHNIKLLGTLKRKWAEIEDHKVGTSITPAPLMRIGRLESVALAPLISPADARRALEESANELQEALDTIQLLELVNLNVRTGQPSDQPTSNASEMTTRWVRLDPTLALSSEMLVHGKCQNKGYPNVTMCKGAEDESNLDLDKSWESIKVIKEDKMDENASKNWESLKTLVSDGEDENGWEILGWQGEEDESKQI